MKLATYVLTFSLLSGCKLDDSYNLQPATVISLSCFILILLGITFYEICRSK